MAEQKMFNYKLKFETIVKGLPRGLVAVIEKDLTYSFFDGQELKNCNLRPHQFIGQKIGVLASGESLEDYRSAVNAAFGGTSQSFIINFMNEHVCYHALVLPLIEEGTVERVLMIGENITEKKRYEKKILESEQLLRTWFNSNVIGQIIWNIDGQILDANPAFLNMLGYTYDEVINQKINTFQATMPDNFDYSRNAIEELLMGAPFVTYEKEFITKDSRILLAEVTICFFQGRKDRGFSYIRNLSEISKFESELKIAETRYSQVVSMQKEIVVRILVDSTILYANPSFSKTFSHDEPNVIGKTLKELFTTSEFETFNSIILAIVESKESTSFEDCYKNTSLWITWNLSPVLFDGKTIEIQCVGIDISHIKWAEQKIVEQNKLLQENNLRLQKLNYDLDNFVSRVTHDLRSPLASIRGILDLAKLTNKNPELNEYLDLMKSSIKKLENFISDVLDLAKSTKLTISGEEIDLKAFLNQVFDALRFSENSEKVKKIIEIEQKAIFYGDKQRLDIIFSNLVGNAIRYANLENEESFVKITCRVNHKQATFLVTDNGIGIEEKHLPHIFEMFYRGNVKKTGTGLGLYIVKEAVEKLGGTIKVYSNFGKGTTFSLHIPNINLSNQKDIE